jgi:nickel-type superoxide dismutase maturation protease
MQLPLSRYVVHDTSMAPTLRPGDRVFVWRWPGRLRAGDVVVVRDPELPGLHLVKRLAGLPGQAVAGVRGTDGFALLGEQPSSSRDSRRFGRLPRQAIVGRVVWRYLPGPRRGPIPRLPAE